MPEAAQDIQRKSNTKHNWKYINANSAAIRLLDRETGYLREAVFGDPRRQDSARPRFPFRIYATPNSMRETADEEAWHKFKVQHGYCNSVKTTDCDDADGEGTIPVEIVVPIDETAVTRYYVWVEIEFSAGTNVETAQIKHGDTPADNGWTSYPDPSGDDGKLFVMLGWIDALTDLGIKKATVRQFQFQDILVTSAGAGDPRWA